MSTLHEQFHEIFGRPAEGVWAAPGRVNLIGEHTDYNDGFVLPFALPHRAQVAAARRNDRTLVLCSLQSSTSVSLRLDELKPGSVTGWAAYAAGVVWALRAAGHTVGGMELLVDGDVPLGAGLSSSAALECAVALAGAELHALELSRTALAQVAQRAENAFVGMPCGIMDQSASLLCAEGHALLLDTRTMGYTQVPFHLEGAGLTLLVVDTRAPHRLVDGEYAERRRQCEKAAHALGVTALRDVGVGLLPSLPERLGDSILVKRARHVVTENARVLTTVDLLRRGAVADIGPLLTASHASLRDDYEVTVPELDVAVAALLDAGAMGARMVGGGFGGCVIALAESFRTAHLIDMVEKAFAEHGFAAPAAFTALPSAGAHRLA